MIHEKGLCKVLSAAYKGGGYSVIPVRRQVETVARSWRRNEIILNGATWAVRCLTEDLPKEAAVQIVKDVGVYADGAGERPEEPAESDHAGRCGRHTGEPA